MRASVTRSPAAHACAVTAPPSFMLRVIDKMSATEATVDARVPDAGAPHCVHADRCSGCPLLDRSPGERLVRKRERVMSAASRFSSLEAVFVREAEAAPNEVEYRTRAKLMVGPGGELGLFAKQIEAGDDHVVVDVPGCLVLSPVLRLVAAELRAMLPHFRHALADAGLGAESLRAFDLREVVAHPGADGPRVLVTFVVAQGESGSTRALAALATGLMAALPVVVGVALNHHDGASPQVLGERTELLAGTSESRDRVGEAEFPATFGAFVQAHRAQAARIQARLIEAASSLPAGARVLDVYGGSGVLAVSLARRGYRVTTVDSFAPALRYLECVAAEQGLPVKTLAGDAAEVLTALAKQGEAFDLVVVNPPRRGLHPLVREALAKLGSPRVLYVSCDPDTLTRDLDHLALLGLFPAELAPYDLIPLTDEVETVAALERRAFRAPHVIAETDSMAVFDKPAHESTVPSIDCGAHLLARVQRIEGFEHAWHVFDLEVGVSGPVVFGRTKSDALRWADTLRTHDTRRVYVGLAKGITPIKGVVNKAYTGRHGENATTRTRYRRLAVVAGHSVVRIVAEVGDPVALRRHLASIGHPLIGDDRFGHAASNRYFQERHGLDRLFLHLVRIECTSADSGERLYLESQLAGDLRAVLERVAGHEALRLLEGRNALGHEGFSSMPPAALEGGGELPAIPQSAPLPRILMPPKASDSGSRLPE
jgi:23S rRNA (uracil1939-C5)-methyltransferase